MIHHYVEQAHVIHYNAQQPTKFTSFPKYDHFIAARAFEDQYTVANPSYPLVAEINSNNK